ncbi:hypothetical protein AAIH60_36160, partial [Pseudomonas aeruginosa]
EPTPEPTPDPEPTPEPIPDPEPTPEEEQVKFIEDNATACDSSPLNQYQRRFSQDVAPQYVDISAGGGK